MIRLGKVAGAPIILTGNLLLYAGIYILITLMQSGVEPAFMTLLGIVAVATCVLLHEIGHVLAAKRYGIRPINITLNFFGGIASNDPNDWRTLMDRPGRSALIWFCGPLVNILIALALTPIIMYCPVPAITSALSWVRTFNLGMAVFNLLPIYPMDGGGILYSFLRMVTTKARAIRVTSVIGIIGAIGLLALAIYLKAFVMGIIAVFILVSAAQAPKSGLFQ